MVSNSDSNVFTGLCLSGKYRIHSLHAGHPWYKWAQFSSASLITVLVCIRVEIVSSLSVKRGLGNTSLFLSPVNRVCAGNVVRVAFSFPSPLAQSCTENEEHHGNERGQERAGAVWKFPALPLALLRQQVWGGCSSAEVSAAPGNVSLLHPWLLPGTAGSGCQGVPSSTWQLCSTKPALHFRQAWSLPRDFPCWILCSLAWIWLQFLSQQTGSVLSLCDNNDLLLHSEACSILFWTNSIFLLLENVPFSVTYCLSHCHPNRLCSGSLLGICSTLLPL